MTKYDKALIVMVAFLSAIGIYIGRGQLSSGSSKYAYIEVDGEKYREIIFDENTEVSVAIDTEYGHNEIKIEDGEVQMVDSDCNDQLCVDYPPISKIGEINICLPNRVSVEVRGSDDSDIDYISH